MIDVSYCNSITRIFEDPVGSGNYKATFEVKSSTSSAKIPFYYNLKLSLLSPHSQESVSASSTRTFGTKVNGLSLPASVLGSVQAVI